MKKKTTAKNKVPTKSSVRDDYTHNRDMMLEDFQACLDEIQRDTPSVGGKICDMDFRQFSALSVFRSIQEQEEYIAYTEKYKPEYAILSEEKDILKDMVKRAKKSSARHIKIGANLQTNNADKLKRLNMKGVILNNEALWVPITITPEEVAEAIEIGTLQEEESKKLGLNDRSFDGDEKDSLARSIAAKQAEYAVRRYGGGTARIVRVNEFHDLPDVGQVNVRYTFDVGFGLMITKRDQGKVPIVLVTGKCPDFKLMGWHIPDYVAQTIYKVHSGRCPDCSSEYGFLQEMKPHERLHVNMQSLLPMEYLNKDLIK